MKFRSVMLPATLAVTMVPAIAFAQANTFSDDDKSYLKDATEGNLAEIRTAQLALKTSKNPDVLKFAHKMITDHNGLIAGTRPVAAKAGVKLPTSPSIGEQASYLKLKVLSGETFDKSYVKTMVEDHQSDIDKTKKEHDSTSNADMKKLTAHAGEVMLAHKEMIDGIAGKMGVQ